MALAQPVPPTPPARPAVPDEIAALGQLMAILGQDPKYRPEVLRLVRAANPQMPIPELDVAESVRGQIDDAKQSVEARAKAAEDRLETLERMIRRDRWAESNGLSEEEMTELESFAKEKKIGDPAAALDYYRLGRPRSTGPRPDITAESRKELHANPRAWALREGERVLQEIRRSQRGA